MSKKHKIFLTDIECMLVLDGLNMIMSNRLVKQIDKDMAHRLRIDILDVVSKDKRKQGLISV